MQAAVAVDEMSGSQLLDHVGELAATQRRCEVEILRAAAQHAYLHDPEILDPVTAGVPGRERAIRIGGDGTPEVTEFAAAELGARLGLSSWSAGELIADALDLNHRLPQLWSRVERLEVRAYLARYVAKKTRNLTLEQAAYVDGRVAEHADGRLTWTRFQTLVEAMVKAADPETAAARERAAAEQQVARPTRSDEDGMRGFYIRAPFATIAVFDATLARIAQILADLGDTETLDRRRVKALLILARPDLAAQLIAAYQAWGDRPADPDLPATDHDLEDTTGVPAPRTGDKPRSRLVDAAPGRGRLRPPLRRARLRGHRQGRGLRSGHRDLAPRPPRPALPVHCPASPRHRGPGPGRRLRDPRPT